MQNISFPVPDPSPIPYPEAIDRVYYYNHTFTDATEFQHVSAFSGLRYFYLYNSSFPTGTQISALSGLGGIAPLYYIYLLNVQGLTGGLPAAWGACAQLQRIYLDRTLNITPTVPVAWGGLNRLRYFYARSVGWSTADVDQFLSSFLAAVNAGMGSSYTSGKRLYLTNNGSANANGAPTGGAANPDIVALNALGWTVYHN